MTTLQGYDSKQAWSCLQLSVTAQHATPQMGVSLKMNSTATKNGTQQHIWHKLVSSGRLWRDMLHVETITRNNWSKRTRVKWKTLQ